MTKPDSLLSNENKHSKEQSRRMSLVQEHLQNIDELMPISIKKKEILDQQIKMVENGKNQEMTQLKRESELRTNEWLS